MNKMPELVLIDYSEPQKNGKTFKVATFFDPSANARRKIVTKFLNEAPSKEVLDLCITPKEFNEYKKVDIDVDLSGNVVNISPAKDSDQE